MYATLIATHKTVVNDIEITHYVEKRNDQLSIAQLVDIAKNPAKYDAILDPFVLAYAVAVYG